MIGVLVGLGGVFLILVFAELLWHQKLLHGEVARKFIHMLVGVYVAFWPLLMPLGAIAIASIAFLFVLLISKELKIFRSIHNIERKTWGDILFAVGIGVTALLVRSSGGSVGIFTVAILHLACADGLAAIVGKRFRFNKTYITILKHRKSIAGTTAFWIVSNIIIVSYAFITGEINTGILAGVVITVPTILTIIENYAVYGADNILVPLAAVLLLWPLTIN